VGALIPHDALSLRGALIVTRFERLEGPNQTTTKGHRMTLNLTPSQKALLASYGRSLLASAVATYTATQSPTATLNAVWAAAIPTAMRYFNPADKAFGRAS
jgi:hypothetical protein